MPAAAPIHEGPIELINIVVNSQKEYNEGRWTKEEHNSFVQGLELYGKEWKKIATLIPTRSIVQIRTHAQKFFQKVARVNFEKQGKQVPDALKSTAIKSSYNFQTLQQALNDHQSTSNSNSSSEFEGEGEDSTSSQSIESPKSPSSPVQRERFKKQTRRTRRKSSKYSLDLQNLSLMSEEEENQMNSEIKSVPPILGDFDFSINQFSDTKRQRASTHDHNLFEFGELSLFDEFGSIKEEEEEEVYNINLDVEDPLLELMNSSFREAIGDF